MHMLGPAPQLMPHSWCQQQVTFCSCLAGSTPCRMMFASPTCGLLTRHCISAVLLEAFCSGALRICLSD